jgi:uncharacterized protein YndB with AHSA1/START domain
VPRIEVYAHSPAPPAAVWRWLADARSWSTWGRFPGAALEREGSPPPDGVGAIRRMGRPPLVSREEVLEFDPPRRLAYTLRSGLPVRDYRADVDLIPDGEGTLIAWRSRFEPKYAGTGTLLALFVRAVLTDTARRLASYAATH